MAAAARAHPGITIAETGDASASDAQNRIVNGDLHRVELLAIPVTLLVLLLAFGSVVAAVVPLLLGLTAVAAGLGLLGPISHVFPVQDSAKTVILLIGLAVGVDYALFYVARCRQERRAGATPGQALETTSRTSGRTVVVSGSIVALAMAGMFVPGLKVLNGIAAGTIAVIASPWPGRSPCCPPFSPCWGRRSTPGASGSPRPARARAPAPAFPRRPGAVPSIGPAAGRGRPGHGPAAGAGLPGAVAAHGRARSDRADRTGRSALQTLTAVQNTFPGAGEPAYLVVQVPGSERQALIRALARLQALAARDGITHPPFRVTWNTDHTAAALEPSADR